jgi:hypothetical protein
MSLGRIPLAVMCWIVLVMDNKGINGNKEMGGWFCCKLIALRGGLQGIGEDEKARYRSESNLISRLANVHREMRPLNTS